MVKKDIVFCYRNQLVDTLVCWLIDIYGNHAKASYSSAWVNLGYNEASLFRASFAVKCQVTLHASSFRMFSQAETSCLTVSRKSTDGDESRARFCAYRFKETGMDPCQKEARGTTV